MNALGDLFPGFPDPRAGDARVGGLTADSRAVRPGHVFFAVPGTQADGLAYAPQAIAAGAIAIVCRRKPEGASGDVVWVETDDVRAALAAAAARFHPRQPETIVAVTGTSGKTSVAAFVRQIWTRLGHRAAALGTTGLVGPDGAASGSLTTPDPVALHAALDRLAGEHVTHLVLEASSHGLDQKRLDGVRLAAGGFTNLSRDHLDYHPDMDSYLAAKLRLFDALLQPGQWAVINSDSDVADRVVAACRARGLRVLTCGVAGDLQLLGLEAEASASRMTIRHEGRDWNVRLPLAGAFMASNALVAAGLCLVAGAAANAVFAALETLEGAPGRLELVGRHNGASIFVDYAHKPDALEKALQAVRALTRGRLVVVFGCGGDRDRGKRALMGAIAARCADVAIVTDDNPRSEDPARIRAEILAGAPDAMEIADRAEAIRVAVASLRAGDALIVAGKGHESGQIVGDVVTPFSDHEAVRAALAEAAA